MLLIIYRLKKYKIKCQRGNWNRFLFLGGGAATVKTNRFVANQTTFFFIQTTNMSQIGRPIKNLEAPRPLKTSTSRSNVPSFVYEVQSSK